MNKRRNVIKALSLGLLLILAFPCFSVQEAGETVTQRGMVTDDLYAAGGTVDIDADIAGDALVCGGDVSIRNRIQGDVMACGGSVNISGEILDDVRTAGGDITIDAIIGDDLVAAGGEIKLSSETSIGGEARLAGGEVYTAGSINQGLSVAAGNIRLSGNIQGDVQLEGGDIEILEGTLITGNLHYKSPNEANIHPEAKITGNISHEQKELGSPHRDFGIFFSLTMLVAGTVLFLLFPDFTMSSAGWISSDPWKSLGVGFILLVVTPIAAILLMGIVLGIWVGLSILALYLIALLVGSLISIFFVSDLGASLLHKDVTTTGRRLLFFTLAIILLGLLQLIPLIGGLLTFALLLLGMGAGVLQLHYVYSQSRA